MNKKHLILIISVFIWCGIPTIGRSALENGGFETGDFSGWETAPSTNTQVVATVFNINPASGSYQALLKTAYTNVYAPQLELFSGIPSGSLSYLAKMNNPETYYSSTVGTIPVRAAAVDGSAIRQTFSASAGDELFLSWDFLPENHPTLTSVASLGDGNYLALPFNDFAYLSIVSPESISLFYLVDCNSSAFVNSANRFETGWTNFSFIVPKTGQYTLSVGVVDLNDSRGESDLLVDSVRVPEPGTLSLLGLGLLGMVGFGMVRLKK